MGVFLLEEGEESPALPQSLLPRGKRLSSFLILGGGDSNKRHIVCPIISPSFLRYIVGPAVAVNSNNRTAVFDVDADVDGKINNIVLQDGSGNTKHNTKRHKQGSLRPAGPS